MKKNWITLICLLLLNSLAAGQDYVNVTFRHYPTAANVVRVFVPGSFNNWGPHLNGFIDPGAPSLMTYNDSLSCYVKVLRLLSGSSFNYKFHEHYNSSGSSWNWLTDPLNPLVNHSDNNNSIINVEKAMIFEISPKSGDIVSRAQPVISAGVFAAEDDSILADQSTIYLDGSLLSTFEGYLIPGLSILSDKLPELSNGTHKVVINVVTQNGESASDSTEFTVNAGDVLFFTPSIDSVWAGTKTIRWRVNLGHTKLTSLILRQIYSYPITLSAETEKDYEYAVSLRNGENKYVIQVMDTAGVITLSDTLRLFYHEPQKPEPGIVFQLAGDKIKIIGSGNDPQEETVSCLWSTQMTNPAELPGVDGRTENSFEIKIPAAPGDYAIKLAVTDQDGYSNSTVNFFTVKNDSLVIIPGLNTVPDWVAAARIYSMFIKSYAAAGTIQAAADNLEHIKNMGFSVIWLLPVMDVEGVVDQNTNIGYNIMDFYNVEPAYGSNDDFKIFVERAHELGMRVILDVTPNHSSRSHAIALDVRSKRKCSRYYDFYQHEIISHNDNGLGQSVSSDGIVYYSGFSDALLNWDWSDAEAREYMLNVYTHWLREYDIDGFRFDVYWGPHRRYGRDNFDRPLRAALRAAKADIMLLGETSGTGAGTEVKYADCGGGMDLGYDWSLFHSALASYPNIGSLNGKLYNGGYRPGPNSFFLRFLENHDEWRIAKRYESIEKTIPVSTAIFMATGIPMLYQGQEVGMGFGMSGSKEYLARSTINWQSSPAKILAPHYQKIAQIRAQFPAFQRQLEDRNNDGQINSSDPTTQPRLAVTDNSIYAFGRPYPDQNGIAVMNFSSQAKSFGISLRLDRWAEFSADFSAGQNYYVNNLYQNTTTAMTGAQLDTLFLQLKAYEVAIFTISTREEQVELPHITVDIDEKNTACKPKCCRLFANYPNPFNPATTIQYELARVDDVRVEIYNLIGQRVKTLVNCKQVAGSYMAKWDGLTDTGQIAASGIYLYRLQAGDFVQTKKMALIR